MNREQAVTMAIAITCLFVVGSAAGTLESSVDSTPSEVIDLDYGTLPIDADDATVIRNDYQSTDDGDQRAPGENVEHSDPEEAPPDSGDGSDSESPPDGDPPDEQADGEAPADADPPDDRGSTGNDLPEEGDDVIGSVLGPQSPLDRALDLVGALLKALVALLAAAIVVVGAALAVRYRETIRAQILATLARWGVLDTDERTDGTARRRPEPDYQNDISRAWHEMTERLGLSHDDALTPRERAVRAREAGADADIVWSLTELFEEVKYGGAPVTDERRRRARRQIERFRAQHRGDDR